MPSTDSTLHPAAFLVLGALALIILVAEVATTLVGGEPFNGLLVLSMGLVVVSMALSYRKAKR